jgi:hypothetical protein
MTAIDFNQFQYYPCLQCTDAEQIGYRELHADDKDIIIPIVELSQIKNEASFAETIIVVHNVYGTRPFILDLSKDRAPQAYTPKQNPDYAKIKKMQEAQDAYNIALLSLLNPNDGFSAWRQCASEFPNAIPVLQFTDPVTQSKSIVRQAAQFCKSGREKIAIRINSETSDEIFPIIGHILAILDSADQLLLIIDCGQVRQKIADRAEFAKKAVARITEELDPSQVLNLTAVCLHDSFTTPPDGATIYESHSREVWREASTSFPFLYGDYAGYRRRKNTSTYMPGDWKAQVAYALPEAWIIYKHPNSQDANGWIVGSKAIVENDAFDDALECWGSNLIKAAAAGDLGSYSSARYWHAAKINMHIQRQIQYASEEENTSDE